MQCSTSWVIQANCTEWRYCKSNIKKLNYSRFLKWNFFVTDQRLQQIRYETSKDLSLMSGWDGRQTGFPSFCTWVLALQGWICPSEWFSAPRNNNNYSSVDENRDNKSSLPLSLGDLVHYQHNQRHHVLAKDEHWLKEAVQKCETCQQRKPALPKEPVMTYPIPSFPWKIVASDCFEFDGLHHLVVVDLSSKYLEIKELKSLTTVELVDNETGICGSWYSIYPDFR